MIIRYLDPYGSVGGSGFTRLPEVLEVEHLGLGFTYHVNPKPLNP